MKDLVLFGIQGSGKGTQARKLVEDYGYYLFEAGGELRAMAASGSELGETVKSYIDNGKLVPHEIIMEVVSEAVKAQSKDQAILFDGIPRDEDQWKDFERVMAEADREYRCLQILLDEQEALERIKDRADKEGRADDADTEKVQRRIGWFRDKTMPVIEKYHADGRLIRVDGDGSVDDVYARIVHALDV